MNRNYKQDFPIFKHDVCFLDSGASAQKPYVVIDAMKSYLENSYANIHRGLYFLSETSTELYENARENVARYLNANSKEIIFTKGATEAINLVASSLNRSFLSDEDEVLISIAEHHANFIPWQQSKAKFVVFNLDENGNFDMDDFKKKLSKKTKVVAMTAMSNVLGAVYPIKEIIKEIRNFNPEIMVLIDGAQYIAHNKVDVKDLDADFFVFSGHKIYGPTGIGVLYGKYHVLEKMPPYQFGGDMVKRVTILKTDFAEPPARFEAGTPPIAEAIGLSSAIDYIDKINLSDHKVFDYLKSSLKKLDFIKIMGNPMKSGGLISFVINNINSADVGTLLAEQNIAVRVGHHCAEPLVNFLGYKSVVRSSLGVYNDKKDIDRLVKGLKKVKSLFK